MKLAFDSQDFVFYSTPDDLRAMADALEEAGQSARISIQALDTVVSETWEEGILYWET